MPKLLNILILIFVNLIHLIYTHPAPSSAVCHGLQFETTYNYVYKTTTFLNNNDHLGKEPIGFKFETLVSMCNVWQDNQNYILHVNLDTNRKFKTLKDQDTSDRKTKKFYKKSSYPLFAHIHETENTQRVVNFFVHNLDTITDINIKKAIVLRLHTKKPETPIVNWSKSGLEILESYDSSKNLEHFESMLKPDKINNYEIKIKLNQDHSFVKELQGWQNISFISKLYKEAHSKFYSTFQLSLKNEDNCPEASKYTNFKTLDQVLGKLQEEYTKTNGNELTREKQPCHNCKQLTNLVVESRNVLTDDKAATIDLAINFLKFVERIRSSGPGAGKAEILKVLNLYAKLNKIDYKVETTDYPPEILSTLLDYCAAARTEASLEAALEHLNLPANNNLNVAERFLVSSSVSCMTLANTNAANSAYFNTNDVQSAYLNHNNVDTSHVYLIEQLLQSLTNRQWSSRKLKWATQLAIGNLIRCHNILLSNEVKRKFTNLDDLANTLNKFSIKNQNQNFLFKKVEDTKEQHLMNVFSDELNLKVIDYLIQEYQVCEDVDCREVLLVSIGNTGNLVLTLNHLNQISIQTKWRREQVAALKALKECLDFNFKYNPVISIIINNEIQNNLSSKLNHNGSKMHLVIYNQIKELLASVVYNSKSETTSRILSGELIANYFSDDLQLINTLIRELRHFNNFELTTLMWTKMQYVWNKNKQYIQDAFDVNGNEVDSNLQNLYEIGDVKQSKKKNQLEHLTNWVHAPNVLNGSSTLFLRHLGGSSTMNATYGISMELLSTGKILKETNFDVGLEGLRAAEQPILGVSIFARGLNSFSSSDQSEDNDDYDAIEEPTTAGMSLRILNVQLRPYTFFTGKSELMSHIWSGTGTTPTPIFRANFLIADHEQAIALLNGFVLEEKMSGVFLLDVLGEVSVSLWNRNSHSVVTANSALLIRGSHSILTSQLEEAYIEQRFAFGGSGQIEFVTDTDFYNTPFRMCLQITQPQFNIRHNTRKYEQINAEKVTRRIHRRNYKIHAKSYPLHQDNNEMCASMNL